MALAIELTAARVPSLGLDGIEAGLAELSFARGLPGESQRRYEQAAGLAPDAGHAATALRCAAGAAKSRHFGDDALRLLQAAADAAVRAGDRAGAAMDLAQAAEMCNRTVGLMATAPAGGLADDLLARGRALAGGNVAAEARLLTAEAYNGDDADPVTAELAERAIALARRAGDPLTESAALDEFTSIQLARGELRAALASALRRTETLDPLPVTALSGLEHSDSLQMAAECATAAGDLRGARRLAERVRDLPFHREEGHLATARLIVVTALTGDWEEALALAGQFREGWERAGRPRAGNLTRGAYAAATVHGLRGDDDARAAWLDIVDALATPGRPPSTFHFNEFFDALLFLHRGQGEAAAEVLGTPPEQFRTWASGMWRPWYAALWAEAAVVTGHPDAAARIRRCPSGPARRASAASPPWSRPTTRPWGGCCGTSGPTWSAMSAASSSSSSSWPARRPGRPETAVGWPVRRPGLQAGSAGWVYRLATSACLARTASAAVRRAASSASVRSRSTTRRTPSAPISASTPR